MIDLKNYIDNDLIKYKVQTWINSNNKESSNLSEFATLCKEKHCIDKEAFDDYYNKFQDVENFVNFCNDNVTRDSTVIPDYKDAFYNIMRGYIDV